MQIKKINVLPIKEYGTSLKTNKKNDVLTNVPQTEPIKSFRYQPAFTRKWAEHKSWGAVIDPDTKECTFKIFTYPDVRRVTVTVQKRNTKQGHKYELENKGGGIFETPAKIPAGEVSHGDKYSYTIYQANEDTDTVKDPYSFRQEKLLGESTIYDHSLYKWHDNNWFSNDKGRISRKADRYNGLTPVNKARIYKLNTVSYTKYGTFKSIKPHLARLKALGFNAIELMPAENTYSFNWGYDGVDKLAPSEHLGGPDGLKSLIDAAHEAGLNVIMDMVPNHLGPDGASLRKTGPYIKGNNAFGEAFNFEGSYSRYVRDFIVNAALNWLDNYHCDGLRLDMTKYMESDYTLKQMIAEINYHRPDAFIIAEDGRDKVNADNNGNYWQDNNEVHDKRVINPLTPEETGEGKNEDVHDYAISEISQKRTSLGRLGCNSEWDFNYFHTLNEALYGYVDLDKLEHAFYCSQDRVKYVMSHDEIGNFEGTRLIPKLMVPILNLNYTITLNDTDIERAKKYSELKNCSYNDALNTVRAQKAQLTSEKLALMLQTGKLDEYNTNKEGLSRQKKYSLTKAFDNEVLRPLDIKENSGITYDILNSVYNRCFNKYKMAIARTYSLPGEKMIFQGDESADLTPFRFFRQFDSVPYEDYLYTEKGYEPGKSALDESKQGSIKYSSKGQALMNKFQALVKDLNKLNEENPALTSGILLTEDTVKHYPSKVIATHSVDDYTANEIYTVTNFVDEEYPRCDSTNYFIKFPKGQWVEILNTDNTKYGGSGNFINKHVINSNGFDNVPIKMASYSTLLFKRVG